MEDNICIPRDIEGVIAVEVRGCIEVVDPDDGEVLIEQTQHDPQFYSVYLREKPDEFGFCGAIAVADFQRKNDAMLLGIMLALHFNVSLPS